MRVMVTILLTKITAAQNEVALSYHCMRGLHFLAVIFAATIEAVFQVFQIHISNILHH